MNDDTSRSRSTRWGAVLYWLSGLVFAVCLLSAVMSVALFEGDERYQGALRWLAAAVVAVVVNRVAKRWTV